MLKLYNFRLILYKINISVEDVTETILQSLTFALNQVSLPIAVQR